ncbi:IS982 family transposase [Emticicia agri]|nr:IS982 family transposase [Emticicia agri]
MQYNENKLIEIFVRCDDFCQLFDNWLAKRGVPANQNQPLSTLSDSEILTLIIFYHYSGYKCFQYYYQDLVRNVLVKDFPKIPSYNRFIELIPYQTLRLQMFLKYLSLFSIRTGNYFIDSKKMPVCDNRRIHSNKVFVGFAGRGKSSTGWFYGLKTHLIINELGQIINFALTPANISDNDDRLMNYMFDGLKGQCFGDKGYLTKLFEQYYLRGLLLITKVRKNMKNKLMKIKDKINLKKRALIESVNDILMTVFDIDHTRHRNPINAMAHTFGGLIAYCFYETKPATFIIK